jgi:hypothetical protein
MSSTCPYCGGRQDAGLLDNACTTRLEDDLRGIPGQMGVAELVHEMDLAMSKQSRLSGGGGKTGKGWAREKQIIDWGKSDAAADLASALVYWARAVNDTPADAFIASRQPAVLAAQVMLDNIDAIRRHPDVIELVDGVSDALKAARHVIDRQAEREFLGTCKVETSDDDGHTVTCMADIYAKKGADKTTCPACGITHEVAERRIWLLNQASNRLFTVREAAQMMGKVGDIKVTEASIRGYIHRGRLGYHTGRLIRLGDLLITVALEGENRAGRSATRTNASS